MTTPGRTPTALPQRALAVLLALFAANCAHADRGDAPDQRDALRQGREIATLALGDEVAALWPRLGAQLQAAIGDAAGLQRISAQVRAQLGPVQSILDERIESLGEGYHYRRVTRHELDPTPLAIDIHVIGDSIEGLRFAPAPEAGQAKQAAAGLPEGDLPDGAWIQARLDAAVAGGDFPSVIVGVVDSRGRRFFAAGDAGDGHAPDPETVFEAGSITKGLTGLLLAQMIASGEVRAGQTIGSLFPGDVTLSPVLASLTLEELASHHSGLPRLPGGAATRARLASGDPYAGSTPEALFADVAAIDDALIEAGRGRYAYSNLGSALLGQLLARAGGRSYASLLAQRVFAGLALGPAMLAADEVSGRHATGHREGRPVASWRLDAYAPAGAWRAGAGQMLELAERLLAAEPGWVGQALERRAAASAGGIGLGWHHGQAGSRRIVWHNGITAGFSSFLAIVPAEGLAVVVLANGAGGVDALATSILSGGS